MAPGRILRLFVAVEIPPEVAAAVTVTFAPWRGDLAGARWVDPERLHVTLRFLGQVRADRVTEVSAAVAQAASTVAPFVTRLDEVGAFPSPARARVLWAGLEDRPGRMAALALALDAALSPAFRPEVRPFHPHVTVARCDPPAALPATFGSAPLDGAGFEVRRAALFQSVRAGDGPPRYELLAGHALTG